MDSFLLELLMSDQEKGLYQALLENPQDKATRNAYVDFLKENNRHVSAKQVEDGYTFRLGYAGREVRSGDGNLPYFPHFSGAVTIPCVSTTISGSLSSGSLINFTNPNSGLVRMPGGLYPTNRS
jgi:uncharacterized protein (TIGR02996 family)